MLYNVSIRNEVITMEKEFLNDYDERVIALAQHLEINLEPNFNAEDYPSEDYTEEEIEQAKQDAIEEVTNELDTIVEDSDNVYSYYGEEYEVLTDDEADDRWEEELDNYIEECIMPELPEHLQNSFDEDAWKRDARYDGRGHSISRYDGEEYEETVNGTTYYIYRQN